MGVKYSDREDIPSPILKALKDDSYSKGLEDHFNQIPPSVRKLFKYQFSATTLPRAPRQRVLFARHSHKVTLDPLTNMWKMFGRAFHSVLEDHGLEEDLVEQRPGVLIDVVVGKKTHKVYIHGAADRYTPSKKRLQDYKLTTAESMLYDEKEEYHAQLNILAYIFKQNGHPVEKLQNVFFFRNWMANRYKEGGKYPVEQIKVIDIPLWSDAEVLKYITERARLHIIAEGQEDDEITECTDKERWMREPKFKVYKIDPKTGESMAKAKLTVDTVEEATEWTKHPFNAFERVKVKGKNTDESNLEKPIKYVVKELKAMPVRCGFCEIHDFCSTYRREQAEFAFQPEEESDD